MNILFVVDNLAAGGAGRVVSRISSALSLDLKYNVYVTTLSNNEKKYSLNENIKYIPLYNGEELSAIKKIIGIRKLASRNKIDVVVSFLSELNVYSIIAGFGAKWKTIISERNDPNVDPPQKKVRIARKIVYPFANGYVFQTKDAKEYFSKKIQNRSEIIFNPISDNIPKIIDFDNREKKIISVGRLVDQKNFPLLINSFIEICDLIPDYNLEIYGEGPKRKELEEIISNSKCKERICLMGQVNNIFEYEKTASLFVMTSNYEGMSNAMMEALALGIPVISTDHPIGGARELIKSGYNGILFPVGDKESLKKEILNIINHKDYGKQLSYNAVKIRYELSLNNIIKKWDIYINKVLEGRNEN